MAPRLGVAISSRPRPCSTLSFGCLRTAVRRNMSGGVEATPMISRTMDGFSSLAICEGCWAAFDIRDKFAQRCIGNGLSEYTSLSSPSFLSGYYSAVAFPCSSDSLSRTTHTLDTSCLTVRFVALRGILRALLRISLPSHCRVFGYGHYLLHESFVYLRSS